MRKIIIMAAICLTGSILNVILGKLCIHFGIPLYLDTILTIAVTMTCGLFWGALCGTLTNFIGHTFWGWGWAGYLFVLCNIATALVTRLFMQFFPRELNFYDAPKTQIAYKNSRFSMVMDRVIVLIILSFALCLAMSFLGGLIAAIIIKSSPSYNAGEPGITAIFSETMFTVNMPVIVTEIAARIPVNIVDRLISAFAGFGIALGLRAILKISAPPLKQTKRIGFAP